MSDEDDISALDAAGDLGAKLRKALKSKAVEVKPDKDALKKVKSKIEKKGKK
jgi:hypothetical protein